MSSINSLRNLRQIASKLPSAIAARGHASVSEPVFSADTLAGLDPTPALPATKKAMKDPEHMAAFLRRTNEIHRAKEIHAAREAPYKYDPSNTNEFAVPHYDFDKDNAKSVVGDQVMVIAGVGTLGRRLANLGAHFGMPMAFLDRPGSGMDQLAAKTNKHFSLPVGSQAIGVEANLTDQKEVRLRLNQVANHFGRIDAMFDTVGFYDGTPLVQSEWDHNKMVKMFEVNAVTPMTLAHEAVPYLKQSPFGGHFGHASTIAIEEEYFYKEPKYAITKLSGHLLFKVAYEQLRKMGIGVSLHKFGPFRGPMAEHRFDQSTLIDPSEAAVDMLKPLLLPPHTGSLVRDFTPKYAVETRVEK